MRERQIWALGRTIWRPPHPEAEMELHCGWELEEKLEGEERSRKNKRGWKVHKVIKKEPSYSLLVDYWHYRLDTGIWQSSASGMHTTGIYPIHCTHCSPPTHRTSPGPSLGLFQLGNPPCLWCHPSLGLEFISNWLVQPNPPFFYIYEVYLRFIKQHTGLKWLETKW